MQASYESDAVLDELENLEAEENIRIKGSGARRVWRLALILLFLLGISALILFVLLPMIQPPLPPLAPALQI